MSRVRLLRCLPVLLALATMGAPAAATPPEPIETLKFADAHGKTIALDAPGVLYLVDFWAIGCKPCIAEMPELDRLAKEYEPERRFRLVSVVYGGWTGKELLKVAKKANTTQPVYSDPNDLIERLTENTFPTKLMIRDGILVRKFRGGGPGVYDRLKPIIDEQLKGSPGAAKP